MKRVITLFIMFGLFSLFVSCACPKHDSIIAVFTPFGPMLIETEKDTFSEKNHSKEKFFIGEGWITTEEYENLIESQPEESKSDKGV